MDFEIKQLGELLPSGCSLIAYDGGMRIGYAHISVSGGIATLADIKVTCFEKKHFTKLPFLTKKYCYRQKGVGTALLNYVIAVCKSSGVSEIQGKVDGDVSILNPWYTKHGFTIRGENMELKFNA